MKTLPTLPQFENRIFVIRGLKVILDSDLAQLYGVPSKRLNEQVKRNRERFPADFMFQLSKQEAESLRSQIATSKSRGAQQMNRSQFATGSQRHRDPRSLPWAFTEHGALMAANVLKSRQAVAMSVFVVRAFVKLREALISYEDLRTEIEQMKLRYDQKFVEVFDKIEKLLDAPQIYVEGFRE